MRRQHARFAGKLAGEEGRAVKGREGGVPLPYIFYFRPVLAPSIPPKGVKMGKEFRKTVEKGLSILRRMGYYEYIQMRMDMQR